MKKLSLFIVLLIAPILLYGYTHFKAPTAWEDLRFPSNAINPPGAASDPQRDQNDGMLSFSGTADNVVAMQVQLPHSWKNGSGIEPHLHLLNTAASAGDSRWRLEWKIADYGDNFPSTYSSETITVSIEASDVKHQIFDFSEIDMTGYQNSCMMIMRLSRLASSDGADTYGTAIKLLEYDIHFRQESFG